MAFVLYIAENALINANLKGKSLRKRQALRGKFTKKYIRAINLIIGKTIKCSSQRELSHSKYCQWFSGAFKG